MSNNRDDMKEIVKALEKKIRKESTRLTAPEAAAALGYSIDEIKSALQSIMETYQCRLQVTENGDLIYDFGSRLTRRNAKSVKDHAKSVANGFWKVFTIIYKGWIAVTLVVYFVIFLVITILIVIALSSQKGNNRRGGSSINLGSLFNWIGAIFRWRTNTGGYRRRMDPNGYDYRQFEPRPAEVDKKKKSFFAAVYDFVFGPEPVKKDPLINHKEVAAFLRKEKGLIVTSELKALGGWTASKADSFFTDCLARFNGDVKVSDDGAVYGEFDDILRGIGGMEGGEIEYYWEEYEEEYELNGNSSRQNLMITAMSLFNLVFSFMIVNGGMAELIAVTLFGHVGGGSYTMIRFFLGWLPLIFSILFFVIPFFRWFRVKRLNQARIDNNIRKRFFKVLFKNRGENFNVDSIAAEINRANPEKPLNKAEVGEWVEKMTIELDGKMDVLDSGELKYSFPRLSLEMQEVERLRAVKRTDRDLGNIEFDSGYS